MSATKDDILQAILEISMKASKYYFDMSGGLTVKSAHESYFHTSIATGLYKKFKGEINCCIEMNKSDINKYANKEIDKHTIKRVPQKGRVDIAIFNKNQTINSLIEVKMKASEESIDSDINRLKGFAKNKIPGYFVLYVEYTTEEKCGNAIENILKTYNDSMEKYDYKTAQYCEDLEYGILVMRFKKIFC